MSAITTQVEARAAYRSATGRGNGYSPSDDSVAGAVEEAIADGWELAVERQVAEDVAALRRGGKTLLVGGDATGGNAWAVEVPS